MLDLGLGRFLQGIDTEAHLEKGRFIGFRLTRLYPDDPRFADLALRPGDTVTRINEQPIQRPSEALAVWEELRTASQLRVDYLRKGHPFNLLFEIRD